MPIKSKVTADKTILLLEDMQDLREKMISDLRALGIEAKILEADCVNAARKLIVSEKVDFVISDWNLPDGTGFEFLGEVKKSKQLYNTPFLMCTTVDEVQNILSAIQSGADEFIVKPWDVDELCEKFDSTWQKYYKA